jgi:hypothetical protein
MMQLLQGFVIAQLHFVDNPIPPPPGNRPLFDVNALLDMEIIRGRVHHWPRVSDDASTEYERAIITRNWYSGPEARRQHAHSEIYASGCRDRVQFGPFWQPEFGTHRNSFPADGSHLKLWQIWTIRISLESLLPWAASSAPTTRSPIL